MIAELTILLHLHAVRIILLIFHGIVITLFALSTSQGYFTLIIPTHLQIPNLAFRL